MHIHTYVAILYAHKRIISHPNRMFFVVVVVFLYCSQPHPIYLATHLRFSDEQTSKLTAWIHRCGAPGPKCGSWGARSRRQCCSPAPAGAGRYSLEWDPTWNWEIYHAVALFQKSTSWWTNDWETHRLIRDYWSHHLRSEGNRWPRLVLSHFRMDTSSSPVTAFLLTVWRQWTATAGCWDAPQASSDMLVSMGPAGRAGGWEGTERGLRDFPSSPGSWKPSSGCSLWFSGPQNKVYSQKHFSSMSCVSGNVQKKSKAICQRVLRRRTPWIPLPVFYVLQLIKQAILLSLLLNFFPFFGGKGTLSYKIKKKIHFA